MYQLKKLLLCLSFIVSTLTFASQRDALEFDFSGLRYSYFSRIIIQNDPQFTITLVAPDVTGFSAEATRLSDSLEFRLQREGNFRRYITLTHERADHALIEHHGCDGPYIPHMHFELNNAITEETLEMIIPLLRLGSYRDWIMSSFRTWEAQQQRQVTPEATPQQLRTELVASPPLNGRLLVVVAVLLFSVLLNHSTSI